MSTLFDEEPTEDQMIERHEAEEDLRRYDERMRAAQTPYPEPDGSHTAGHAGSEASRERAEREVNDGTLTKRQREAISFIGARRSLGATWKEVAYHYGWHHGQASGVLSVLHKAGRLDRLTSTRNRCSVYVLPPFVRDRPTSPHGSTRSGNDREALQRVREVCDAAGHQPGSTIPVSAVMNALEGR